MIDRRVELLFFAVSTVAMGHILLLLRLGFCLTRGALGRRVLTQCEVPIRRNPANRETGALITYLLLLLIFPKKPNVLTRAKLRIILIILCPTICLLWPKSWVWKFPICYSSFLIQPSYYNGCLFS